MKVQKLFEDAGWSVWFDKNTSIAGKSKALGFVLSGSNKSVLVDLHYQNGKPSITAEQFVSVVKKSSNISKSSAQKMLKDVQDNGFEFVLGKKY
jgi:hypothetical protein